MAAAGYLAVLPETATAAAPAQLASHGVSTQEQSAALFDQWKAALVTSPKKVNALYSLDALLLPTVAAGMFDTSSERTGYFTHFLENNPSGVMTESTSRRL